MAEELIRSTSGLYEMQPAKHEKALKVHSGAEGAVLEIQVAVEYGVQIPQAIDDFRARLCKAVQDVAGVPLEAVNVKVADLVMETPAP
jgi:uncharacterized alkaline shock family protein YloU